MSIAEGDFSTALIRQQWKIVYVDSTETVYLYNLENDPRETQDLSSVEPDMTADLMRRLDLYLEKARDVGHQREAPANPETIRQLKALGYL